MCSVQGLGNFNSIIDSLVLSISSGSGAEICWCGSYVVSKKARSDATKLAPHLSNVGVRFTEYKNYPQHRWVFDPRLLWTFVSLHVLVLLALLELELDFLGSS